MSFNYDNTIDFKELFNGFPFSVKPNLFNLALKMLRQTLPLYPRALQSKNYIMIMRFIHRHVGSYRKNWTRMKLSFIQIPKCFFLKTHHQ